MKASVFRVTGSVASLASCLVLCGGVVSANPMSSDSSISDSGRDSNNVIKYENSCTSTVKNNNWVDVTNNNEQTAVSGDANVNGNDDVSNVSTGSASNSSNSNFTVNIDNSGSGGCLPATQTGGNGGGNGGGQTGGGQTGGQTGGMGGETLGTTTVSAPATTPAVSGGLGAEETAATPVVTTQVAAVPVGGVGAGTGSQTYLEGLVAVTLLSGALGATRLYKPLKTLRGHFA